MMMMIQGLSVFGRLGSCSRGDDGIFLVFFFFNSYFFCCHYFGGVTHVC